MRPNVSDGRGLMGEMDEAECEGWMTSEDL